MRKRENDRENFLSLGRLGERAVNVNSGGGWIRGWRLVGAGAAELGLELSAFRDATRSAQTFTFRTPSPPRPTSHTPCLPDTPSSEYIESSTVFPHYLDFARRKHGLRWTWQVRRLDHKHWKYSITIVSSFLSRHLNHADTMFYFTSGSTTSQPQSTGLGGAPAAGGSLFGTGAATNNTGGSLFGQNKPATTTAGGSLLGGNTATSGLFGAGAAASTTGGNPFGSTNTATSAAGGGPFGSGTTATSQPQQQQTGGLFGNAQTNQSTAPSLLYVAPLHDDKGEFLLI